MRFKKLLSNLPFNPSLINQVAFYGKRLNREKSVRRIGLVMVALSLVVQLFAVASPPEPTLAESSNDIIRGGFESREQAVNYCRTDTQDFATVLAYFKISCDALEKASTKTIESTDHNRQLHSIGRTAQGPVIAKTGKPTGEYALNISGTQYFMRNLWAWDSGSSSTYKVLNVKNADGKTFKILFNCGNIVSVGKYTPPKQDPSEPVPVAEDPAVCETRGSLITIPVNTVGRGDPGDKKVLKTQQASNGRYIVSVTSENQHSVHPNNDILVNSGDSEVAVHDVESSSFKKGAAEGALVVENGQVEISVRFGGDGVFSGGMSVDLTPACPEPKDVCPNIAGIQTTEEECDVCPNVPNIQMNPDECYPCPEAEDDDAVTACLELNKTASNLTQGLDDANGTLALGGDTIAYTLSAENTGSQDVKGFIMDEDLTDVLEYADIVDLDGGEIDDNNLVTWTREDIAAGATLQRTITVKVKNPVPQTPASASDPTSYDLVMNNVFYGDAVNIELPAGAAKTTEVLVETLPSTGPGTTVMIGFAVTAGVSYFFARTRLMAKELAVVRSDFTSAGGI